MFRSMKWIAPVAGLALVLGFNQLSKAADEAPTAGKATVNVTVQDKDGKGVEGVRVRLVVAEAPKTEAGAQPKAAGDAPAAGKKPKPVAQGTTDASGKAVLANVPDGEYTVMASLKGGGAGKEMVKVEGGKDVSVTVTLKDRKPKADAGAAPSEAK
jgi:flagellar hook assembly protein FlgD